jgi:hypothetical protein
MSEINRVDERISVVEIGHISSISPHNQALYEAGKDLLNQSIYIGRDYCKFMITTSTGAIPVYLAILAFILPENYSLGIVRSIFAITPVILFLIATVVFTYGYFPIPYQFSLDVIDEIEEVRTRTIQRRIKLTKIGFLVFLIATLIASVVLVVQIGAV